MSEYYFSDREQGPRLRENEEISERAWGGIVATIQKNLTSGGFGYEFPLGCYDGGGNVVGCDEHNFSLALVAEIPKLDWPLRSNKLPPTFSST